MSSGSSSSLWGSGGNCHRKRPGGSGRCLLHESSRCPAAPWTSNTQGALPRMDSVLQTPGLGWLCGEPHPLEEPQDPLSPHMSTPIRDPLGWVPSASLPPLEAGSRPCPVEDSFPCTSGFCSHGPSGARWHRLNPGAGVRAPGALTLPASLIILPAIVGLDRMSGTVPRGSTCREGMGVGTPVGVHLDTTNSVCKAGAFPVWLQR